MAIRQTERLKDWKYWKTENTETTKIIKTTTFEDVVQETPPPSYDDKSSDTEKTKQEAYTESYKASNSESESYSTKKGLSFLGGLFFVFFIFYYDAPFLEDMSDNLKKFIFISVSYIIGYFNVLLWEICLRKLYKPYFKKGKFVFRSMYYQLFGNPKDDKDDKKDSWFHFAIMCMTAI